MKKYYSLLILTIIFGSLNSFAQTVIMGDAGYPQSNPANCNTFGVAGTNFQDPGGGADYTSNFNDTIVFCPDLSTGTKMSISFGINAGFEWDVDGSDFVYVYDGPTASPSTLLGIHNSVTDPMGFSHQASWDNPSGCLTVVFISNGAIEGTGWLASVQCGNQFQPFDPHLEAFVNGTGPNVINPIDTGYVDICFGDSIMFVTKPIFPYSLESTGNGYSQNVNTNIDFEWVVTDGGTYPDNDTIWFKPPARAGYLVDIKLTDQFPQIERLRCKVRVSQLPSFAGTGPLDDIICLGETTELLGGVTQTDTVGVLVPPGTFNLGGNFAGLTYLQDGSGIEFEAPIQISGFPEGSTIDDVQDLNQVCITMEHSYLGDLEIWLECPNGQMVPLVNSYNPGFLTGGTSGGTTFLGHPYDDVSGGGAGIGWEYCFSSVFNTIGSMTQNLTNTVSVPSIPGNTPPLSAGNSIDPADTYAPEASYSGFNGCPVNGTWTIFVLDNLSNDDGYIFEWGLYFDPSLYPGLGSYQNTINNDFWSNDPTIISGQGDTSIVVQPTAPGVNFYTFNVIDDFGCEYDTTVSLTVRPLPTIFEDALGCNLLYQIENTTSFAGGSWAASDTAVHFTPSNTANNPLVWVSTAGTYTLTFTDTECGQSVSSQILFPPFAWTQVLDTTICLGTEYTIYALENSTVNNFVWNTGQTGSSIVVTEPGNYVVTASNICHSYSDTATIDVKVCEIEAPNIISLSSTVGNNLFFVQYDGVQEFTCTILNRWGNKIYEYYDPAGSWDGRTEGGTLVEDGTYFYIIKAKFYGNEEEITKQGFVQVQH